MHEFAAAGAAFLLAVLWFDLMFDVQVLNSADTPLPDTVLASVAGYYRRVTTEARPMNRLVALVMLLTLAALAIEGFENWPQVWLAGVSLALAASAVGLAAVRTVRNAVALGTRQASPEMQSRLARSIYRDHLYCFAAMLVVLGLQLAAR